MLFLCRMFMPDLQLIRSSRYLDMITAKVVLIGDSGSGKVSQMSLLCHAKAALRLVYGIG